MLDNVPPAPEKKELSIKQRQAALFLAHGNNVEQTSHEVGVSAKTIHQWKHNPAFLAAVKQAEDDAYSDTLNRLKGHTGLAIDTLVLLMGTKIAPYVRLGAASKVIDTSLEVYRTQTLEQRLQELEEMMRANSGD